MTLTPREVHAMYGLVALAWVVVIRLCWIDAGKTDARERALEAANRE